MRGWGIALAGLLFAGCTTNRAIYTPDGRQGQAIQCPGTANSWNGCYARAGEICGPRGYEILSRTGEEGAVVTQSFASTTNNRSMIIKCKGD
jgi:hypothetical protein